LHYNDNEQKCHQQNCHRLKNQPENGVDVFHCLQKNVNMS
jgi:hypothetical protein